jgi:acyl-coenzyme A thioesterase PaaI-like protein
MTDIPSAESSVPARFAIRARLVDDGLELDLFPQPEILVNGVIRASVLAYLVDAAAGIALDKDPDVWTLTTDLSLRCRAVPAPDLATSTCTIVRRGRRSSTTVFDVRGGDGADLASGAIGFAQVPRRDGDPPKPMVTPEVAARLFSGRSLLSQPLREAAGIQVLDAASGTVEVEVTPELLNPAGTLQGAMVALVAEVAAEELAATRTGQPVVVTDLDLRYLAKTAAGPVRTRTRPLGPEPDSPMAIELIDSSGDRLTTLVYARAQLLG